MNTILEKSEEELRAEFYEAMRARETYEQDVYNGVAEQLRLMNRAERLAFEQLCAVIRRSGNPS